MQSHSERIAPCERDFTPKSQLWVGDTEKPSIGFVDIVVWGQNYWIRGELGRVPVSVSIGGRRWSQKHEHRHHPEHHGRFYDDQILERRIPFDHYGVIQAWISITFTVQKKYG